MALLPIKTQKISINAGFTCPNRDGLKGWGGCTYCNNQTFSPQYATQGKSVTQQLEEGIRFFSYKYPAMKYIAYFQSYTNTYGSIDDLLSKYNEALSHLDVVGLTIATRPDCVSNFLLDALEKLAQKTTLFIEYGIETTHNETLKFINRGHTYEDVVDAIERTHRRGIDCGAHLILGLPGETRERILSHADKLSELPIKTLKLHQLQLIKGTKMAEQYLQNPALFHLYDVDEYIDLCIAFRQRLNPDIIIERYVSQSPKEMLLLPGWGLKNYEFADKLRNKMEPEMKKIPSPILHNYPVFAN
ncbi:TIGR01212 family radical SAM protein [Bacteroidia bacterium]|nr:TIGR01212 family radical SAM protein [Bacteroidia bacterium]